MQFDKNKKKLGPQKNFEENFFFFNCTRIFVGVSR